MKKLTTVWLSEGSGTQFDFLFSRAYKPGETWGFFLGLSVAGEAMNHIFIVLGGICFDGFWDEFFEWGFALVLLEKDFHWYVS